jgi:hypothetical protein
VFCLSADIELGKGRGGGSIFDDCLPLLFGGRPGQLADEGRWLLPAGSTSTTDQVLPNFF